MWVFEIFYLVPERYWGDYMLFQCRTGMPGATAAWNFIYSFNFSFSWGLEEWGYLSFVSACRMRLLARIPRYSTLLILICSFVSLNYYFTNDDYLDLVQGADQAQQHRAWHSHLPFIFSMANEVASFYFTVFSDLFKTSPFSKIYPSQYMCFPYRCGKRIPSVE